MFDWFWDFLYSISEILFELIDGVLAVSNKLCGIDPITVGDKKTNFLVELLENSKIFMGFAGAALVGIFLLMIFSIIAICRNCKDGKKSSGQIAVEIMKTLGLFFLVPSLMIGFTIVLNEIVILLYKATSSSTPSLGAFLFENFLPNGMEGFEGTYDYTSVRSVRTYMAAAGYDLSDYRFFFSWIISLPILFFVAKALLLFVERCISIVLLFIMSPISLSTTVLDDGARFKFWRDKVITKFLSGYGMIIGLNIYILVLSFITRSDVIFVENLPLISDKLGNFIVRICFALGGAFFLPKVFGMVGDLFTNGAASGEIQGGMAATDALAKTAKGIKDAVSEKDKNKDKKKEKEEKQKKLKSLSKGGSPVGALASGLGGSGNGNHNGLLGKLYDSGKAIYNAIKGTPKQIQPVENNNEDNDDDSSDDNKNNMEKKTGLEKIADTTKKILKTAANVSLAVGTGGKSAEEMNKK